MRGEEQCIISSEAWYKLEGKRCTLNERATIRILLARWWISFEKPKDLLTIKRFLDNHWYSSITFVISQLYFVLLFSWFLFNFVLFFCFVIFYFILLFFLLMLARCSRPSLRELFITICHQPPTRRPFHSRNNCNLFLFCFCLLIFLFFCSPRRPLHSRNNCNFDKKNWRKN